MMDELSVQATAAKLPRFQYVKAIVLEGNINQLMQGFSVENEMLTPTFKTKRPQIKRTYAHRLSELYRELGEADTTVNC